MHLFTIGYGGRTPAGLVEALRGRGVRTLADVRLRPDRSSMGAFVLARAPGRGIEGLLAGSGVGYASLVELGNLFSGLEDWRERYRALLERSGDLLTARLVALPGPVCLMCAEKRPADCHRLEIAEWLARRGWTVEHIE